MCLAWFAFDASMSVVSWVPWAGGEVTDSIRRILLYWTSLTSFSLSYSCIISMKILWVYSGRKGSALFTIKTKELCISAYLIGLINKCWRFQVRTHFIRQKNIGKVHHIHIQSNFEKYSELVVIYFYKILTTYFCW